MRTKQELIQIMRNAHQQAYCNADASPDEAWEAALKALCGALPDAPWSFVSNGQEYDVEWKMKEVCRLYNQLKQWGK